MDFNNASDSDSSSMREIDLNEEDEQHVNGYENESIGDIEDKMESTIIENQKTASTFRMYLCSFLCLLPGFTGGAAISYAAIALPYYMDPENSSGIVMTESQASWFVSLNSPMQMVGNLLAGWAMEKVGRKNTVTISCVLVIIASLILYLAPSYEMLLVGCLLNGTSVGLVRPAIILLLLEISLVRVRGLLGSLNTLTTNGGYLYGLMMGSLVPVKYVPWIIVGPSAVFILFSWYMVESPVWLMKHDKSTEARKVVAWLRGPNCHIEPELKEIEHLVFSKDQASRGSALNRSFLFPLVVLSMMFFFHATVGADDISYYALTIFKYPGVNISPSIIAILFQLAFTVGLMVAPVVMTRIGRRPQFIGGGIGLAITLFVIGCCHHFDLFSMSPVMMWMPVILHIVFGLVFGVGFGPVPYTLTGELFPQHLKALGCGISFATRYVAQFLQLKMFIVCRDYLGMSGVYWSHSVVAVAASIFVFLLLPETRNKTYSELDDIFRKKPSSNSEPDVECQTKLEK